MGLSPDELATIYPRLFHMAEVGSWDSIAKHGLRSTSALLDLFEITGEARTNIESHRRPSSVTIHHPEFGSAVIRDNIPMRDGALERCLEDCTPTEWYKLLNGRVFFWLSRERLFRLLRARAYRNKTQTIITVDTKALLDRHQSAVRLAPINTGSTIYKPLPRGVKTFSTMGDYPYQERRKTRTRDNAVVELTVDYSVPDIAELIVGVEHVTNDVSTRII